MKRRRIWMVKDKSGCVKVYCGKRFVTMFDPKYLICKPYLVKGIRKRILVGIKFKPKDEHAYLPIVWVS